MVCQICGEKSGYYPLCKKHNAMRKSGQVKKCDSCGKWIDTGHPLCKSCYYDDKKQEVPEGESSERSPRQPIPTDMIKIVENRVLRNSIEEAIANAKKSVYILSPYIEQFGHLFSDLNTLIQQKGTVKVVFKEVGALEKNARAIEELVTMQSQIKTEENLHAKLVIVDEQMAIISSANLLSRSFLNNEELGVVTTNSDHVKDALSFFNRIYDKAKMIEME